MSDECSVDMGVEQKQMFGIGALVIGMFMFGGNLIDFFLLAGIEQQGLQPASAVDCVDKEALCSTWAAGGQCESNSLYMHASCPLACRQCVPPPAVAVPAPAPVPVPGGPCGDSDPVQCPRWKENGDCTSNGAWMSANCALSCGACVATPAAAVPAPAAAAPAAAAPAGPCVDSDPVQCPRWKENGDCTSNGAWMSANCALSCGACQPPAGSPQAVLAAAPAAAAATPAAPAACTDSDAEQCPRWKANGDCASNSEWMSTNCCKSCSATAAAAAPAAAAPAVPCVDSDAAQCPQWKNNGDCTSNSEWMQANCRLSCGVCLPAPTKQAQPCTDSDGSQCPVWASNGDCDKNADWMKANCRRSCKVCQLSAKVVFDGQHPESADWDGHLPGEDSHGCKDNVNMPNVGEPQDNCMHLCADTPSCKYFWAEHTGNRAGYCCLKSSYDVGMGTRSNPMPQGRFYEIEGR